MKKLNVKKTLAKLLVKADAVGKRVTVNGSSSMSNISQPADSYVNIGSITLTPGTWVVVYRGRYVPNASGNHYSAIYFSSTSAGAGWHDRRYSGTTYNMAHVATCIVQPTVNTTYYLIGNASAAGVWNRESQSAFLIDAVRIK